MVLVAYLHQHAVRLQDIAMVFQAGEYEGLFRYPDPSERLLRQIPLALALAAAVGASAVGWGTAALRLVRIGPAPLAVRAAFGWALLSLFTFGMGIAGWLHSWLGAAIVVIGWAGLSGRAGSGVVRAVLHTNSRATPGAVKAAFIVVGAVYLIGLLSPEIFYDALVYHLGLPDRYIQAGRIVARPDFLFSQFPQGMEMLYTLGLMLQGEMLARLLNGLVGVTALLAVHALGERIRAGSGWIAALIFVSSPVVGFNTIFTGADLAMAMFALSAMLVVVGGEAGPPGGSGDDTGWADGRRWGAAGVLAGCAAGVKYTGILVVAGMALVLVERAVREGWSVKRGWATLGVLAVGAALPVSPWLIKNCFVAANPVYPFFSRWFGLSTPSWMMEELVAVNRELPRVEWLDWLLLPWRMTMGAEHFGSFAGPAFLMFGPLAWMAGEASAGLSVFAFGGLILGLLVTDQARFLLPALGGLAALIGARLAALPESFPRPSVLAIRLAAAVAIGAGLYGFGMHLWGTGGWRVVVGQQSRAEYLASDKPWYPAGSGPVIDWMNRNLPADARVLLVGEERTYGARRPVSMQSVADRSVFLGCVRRAESAHAVTANLRRAGYTHILLNGRRFQRMLGHELAEMSVKEKGIMDAFMGEEARVIFEKTGLFVIEIPPA